SAANIVTLPHFSLLENMPNRGHMIVDMDPIADIKPIAIDGKRLFFYAAINHAGDKFFTVLMGAIIIAGVGHRHQKIVGHGKGSDKMIGGSFRSGIGRIWPIGRFFGKMALRDRAENLIGGNMMEMDMGKFPEDL